MKDLNEKRGAEELSEEQLETVAGGLRKQVVDKHVIPLFEQNPNLTAEEAYEALLDCGVAQEYALYFVQGAGIDDLTLEAYLLNLQKQYNAKHL